CAKPRYSTYGWFFDYW
nr:immunoglobulin heavy chain junction region [Macaca mulatta]MOW76289.1 immunoglobulin heavy chain junction region [Macaca mulatta]MOW76419.1 immunoglobulin heavy chain junction region [Macaca mulatta]MOW76552.1 immunoglobulin heavy chain junction region [Macaca mulatta]MOW76929.1 immunoglobulin heavy chain junction region [Macaca mulatta]